MNKYISISFLSSLGTALLLYLPKNYAVSHLELYAASFGLLIGLMIFLEKNVTRRRFLRTWAISAGVYFLVQMLIEIALYQPWHQLPLDGHMVDMFALRSVYNSPLVLFYVLASLFFAALPMVFSKHVWKNFQSFTKTER